MITNRQDTASVFDTFKPLIFFAFALILTLTISRLLLVVWQWERVTDVNMLAPVFVQGLRFDLVLLGLSLVIPVLLFPILATTRWTFPAWQLVLRVYLPVVFVLVLFMELSTPSFIDQFDSRPNRLFFEYLNHPKEVSSTLWAAYKLPLILASVILAVSAVTASKQFRRVTTQTPRPSGLLVLLLTPVLCILCVGLVRSTTDHRPVNPSAVALSKDSLVNELALRRQRCIVSH
jgi:phosphoglycerol transferase MdoB-like AlkP superfamily enzyme